MSGIQVSLALFALVVTMTTAQPPIMPYGQGLPGMMSNAAFGYMFSPFGPMSMEPFNPMHPFANMNPYAALNPFMPVVPWAQQRTGAANILGSSQGQASPDIFSGLGSFTHILDGLDFK